METVLDRAYSVMAAEPDRYELRLRFYERLADAELFMILEQEAQGDHIDPRVIEHDGMSFVLAFDTEDRLAEFTGDITPYIAVSGRVLVAMLAQVDLGMGVNLDVAPSSILLPHDIMVWLADMLSETPDEVEARPIAFNAPRAVPQAVLQGLDAKLISAAGLVDEVWLTAVTYEGGAQGHLLAFIGAEPAAHGALAKAAHEALRFCGVEAAEIDVAFFDPTEGAAIAVRRVGMRFELPEPVAQEPYQPVAPGMDPDKPPRLK